MMQSKGMPDFQVKLQVRKISPIGNHIGLVLREDTPARWLKRTEKAPGSRHVPFEGKL